ncbi:NAD(P)/FAD-dependent oxidoreductase [Candidatus Poribacteria bacterium]|jgi:thioredoxin reductase (NADPH)|nr:NAD(P)/FAD-dependent oxidoreductase [Candidatus Poribacteria bacterium]MBT5536837.1 NAD(P)/FAD-dependent oxidoreductase [Candidatus Poribacteria bacterium]MBT7098972.1 NAD(P)/FAD-dependent oxidoreductase [Candidatus Poribacteria bacterium]MBT7808074.1 NAD(P)/FAD-dependent oxidoreductase [Candidatus Poribacteria bacterium]
MSETVYDIAVIGAGPAGAQAAISGSHQMRHVLVLDAGRISRREGRAYWSKTVQFEDVPVFKGITGPQFKKSLREWMDGRPVQDVVISGEDRKFGIDIQSAVLLKLSRGEDDVLLLDTSVDKLDRDGNVQSVETFRARRVIVAAGFEDRWPNIEVDESVERMFDQYRIVFRYAGNRRGWHTCIRCDGHLHVDERMAFYGVGDYIYEMVVGAQDFTDKLTILTDGRPHGMSKPVLDQAKAQGVEIDERKIVRHIGEKTDLLGFEMEDGEEVFFHGCFVDEGLDPNTRFLMGWDAKTDADGLLVVDEDNQVLDATGEPIPGLYAAGDIVAGERKLITAALAMGQNAGLSASDSLRAWRYPE